MRADASMARRKALPRMLGNLVSSLGRTGRRPRRGRAADAPQHPSVPGFSPLVLSCPAAANAPPRGELRECRVAAGLGFSLHHPVPHARQRLFPRRHRQNLRGSTALPGMLGTADRLPPGGGERGVGGRRYALEPLLPPSPLPGHRRPTAQPSITPAHPPDRLSPFLPPPASGRSSRLHGGSAACARAAGAANGRPATCERRLRRLRTASTALIGDHPLLPARPRQWGKRPALPSTRGMAVEPCEPMRAWRGEKHCLACSAISCPPSGGPAAGRGGAALPTPPNTPPSPAFRPWFYRAPQRRTRRRGVNCGNVELPQGWASPGTTHDRPFPEFTLQIASASCRATVGRHHPDRPPPFLPPPRRLRRLRARPWRCATVAPRPANGGSAACARPQRH